MLRILLLLLLPFSVNAEPTTWLELNIGSRHADDTYPTADGDVSYNEKNYGIGITVPIKDDKYFSYTLGFFKNSFYKTSVYGGIDIHGDHTNGLNIGIIMALITGYGSASYDDPQGGRTRSFSNVMPMFYPYLAYRYELINVKVGVFPIGDSIVPTFSIGIALN